MIRVLVFLMSKNDDSAPNQLKFLDKLYCSLCNFILEEIYQVNI